jgi:benzylsuccinate CoA-transferase BbsF subunit
MTGYKEGGPVMSEIPYTDYTGGEHTVFAVMTALMHRLRTGEGQFIDVSQAQTASATVPEALMDYTVNGRIQPRMGNEDPIMSPHGCYPCRGNDRWCAIAVSTDEEWQSLCRVLGQPQWLEDPRFADAMSRWQHRETLGQYLGEATRIWDAQRLMDALQGAGVPAGALFDSKDLLVNPHLKDRQFYEVVPHHPSTGMPPLPYAGRPWKLSETPAVRGKAAPIMGEHNRLLLTELLGYSEEELAKLEGEGVIGYAPTSPTGVQRPSLDEQVRQGRLQRYETDYAEVVEREYGTGAG